MSTNHGSQPASASIFLRPPAVLIAALGTFFIAAFALYAKSGVSAAKPERPPLKVDVLKAETQPHYQIERNFSGQLQARQRVSLGSELAGKVATVDVDEGSIVNRGDLLLALDTSLLEAERTQLKAQIEGVDAQQRLSRLRLQRQSDLKAKGFSAEDNIDAIETEISALDSQKDSLLAAIDSVEIRLQKSLIRAPFDAVVQTRLVDEGSVIGVGAPLLELVERGAVEIKVGVPPRVAAALERNQRYSLWVDQVQYSAELLSVAPAVDGATQTVAVRLVTTGDELNAKIGEFARLVFPEKIDADGLWVPNSALMEGERGLWTLFGVGDDHTVTRHAVRLISADHARAFVRVDMGPDNHIITSGLHRVTPGMRVDF